MRSTVLQLAVVETQFAKRRAVDLFLVKLLSMTEVARIARIERNLRRYIDAKWTVLMTPASEIAGRMARRGKTAAQIERAVAKVMKKWSPSIATRLREDIDRVYGLAREAGWRHANDQSKAALTYTTENYNQVAVEKAKLSPELKPSFDLIDDATAKRLGEQQVLWSGRHYGANVSTAIRETARETLVEAGTDRRKAGRMMQKRMKKELGRVRTPRGFSGTKEQYFEGLSANAATTSRSFGQMRSFIDLGIATYEIVNPVDRRTCPVCSHMIGKVFTVKQGAQTMNAELAATSPAGVRTAHPWMSTGELGAISSKAGAAGVADASALSGKNFNLPPFHFRCRCTVVMASVSPASAPKVKAPKPPGTKTPKPKKPTRPAGWRKMPKTDVTPTQPYDHQGLMSQIAKMKTKKPNAKLQKEIRKQLNAILAGNRVTIRDLTLFSDGKEIMQVTSKGMRRAAAWHETRTGKIALSPSSWDKVVDLAKHTASGAKGKPTGWMIDGLHSMIHEAYHGASPQSVYRGVSAALEEITTEVAARRAVRSILGISREMTRTQGAYSWIVDPANRSITDAFATIGRAKGKTAQKLWQVFQKAAKEKGSKGGGLSFQNASDEILQKAALKFKQIKKPYRFRSWDKVESEAHHKKMLDDFIKSVKIPDEWFVDSGLTKKQQGVLTRRLRRELHKTLRQNIEVGANKW